MNPSTWGTGANNRGELPPAPARFEVLAADGVEFKTDASKTRARPAPRSPAIPSEFEGIHRKHMLSPRRRAAGLRLYAVIDDDWPP